MNIKRGFTLIELIVAIAILAVVAGTVAVRVVDNQKVARDARRKADLRSVQTALELYKAKNGSYPSTVGVAGCNAGSNPPWCGETTNYGSKCYEDGCSQGPYIPGIAPLYMSKLPTDPIKGKPAAAAVAAVPGCGAPNEGASFLYASNGTDYKVLSNCSAEMPITTNDPLSDPVRTNNSFSVYSSGGRNF